MAILKRNDHEFKDRTRYVMEVFGSSLTAYAAGLGETLQLHEWVAGKSSPSGMQMKRLNLLHEVTVKLRRHNSKGKQVRS